MTNARKFRIIIAEDHSLFRQGLKSLLSLEPDFEVVGEAEDGAAAIRCVERLKPDLILLDLSMPGLDGMTAIKEIKKKYSKTKILILTAHATEAFFQEALKFGADGYVVKEADHAELMVAMKSVLRDSSYLSPSVSRRIIDVYLSGNMRREEDRSHVPLTSREIEILKLIANGFKSKEIADQLCISDKTVAKHRANIMSKLSLNSAAALTAYAIKSGLI